MNAKSVLVCMFAIWNFTSLAQSDVTPSNADELIVLNYRARGGYDAIKSVHAIKMTGIMIEGDNKIQFRAEKKRPHFLRINWTVDGMSGAEGYDGSSWELSARGKITRTQGVPADATRRAAEFDEFFVDYKERNIRVEFLGMDRLNEKSVWALKTTLPDEFSKIYYFDPVSFLVIATRIKAPVHATGSEKDLVSFSQDYRKVGNVPMAFSGYEQDMNSGKVISKSHWDEIEINPKISDDWFSPEKAK